MAKKRRIYDNEYDKLLKENIETISKTLINLLLGIKINSTNSEILPTKKQKTLEREPDFLMKIKHKNKKLDYILHIEFQVADNPKMHNRMNFYQAFLRSEYNINVLQYVFYLGKGKSRMKNFIKETDIDFKYNLLNFEDYDYELFVNSKQPEEIILAVLANYKGKNPEDIVDIILQKIVSMNIAVDRKEKCAVHLEVLSKLRNIQEITKQKSNNMAFIYDLETDIRYIEGIEIGEKKGIEIGENRTEEFFYAVISLYKQKISIEEIAKKLNTTIDKVNKIIVMIS